MLKALARRPGILFSRERLLQLTRGDDFIVMDRIIDTYVQRWAAHGIGTTADKPPQETLVAL